MYFERIGLMAKKTGEIVTGKDGKQIPEPKRDPQILGARPIGSVEGVKRLDRNSPVEPQEAQVRYHEELVTVRSHLRSRPLRKDEPDVRIRAMTPEGKTEWERAKRGQDV
jgi:hypothetical protein